VPPDIVTTPTLRRSFAARASAIASLAAGNIGGCSCRRAQHISASSSASRSAPAVSLWVTASVDQPSAGSSFHGWTISVDAASTSPAFSARCMRRNTARIGARKSMVLPPPRIIGSERHAMVGLISPSAVPIARRPALAPIFA